MLNHNLRYTLFLTFLCEHIRMTNPFCFTSHMKSLYEITTLDFIKQHMVFTSQEPLFLPGENTYVSYIWVVLLTNHHSRARSNL